MTLPVPPEHAQPMLKLGRQSWKEVKAHKNYKQYQYIGAALSFGRTMIMRALAVNDPLDGRYRKAFHDWCKQEGYGDMDAATRSHLLFLQDNENRSIAEMIWDGLSEKERRQIATPRPMVNRVKAYLRQFHDEPKRKAKEAEADLAHDLESTTDFDPEAVAHHHVMTKTVRQRAAWLISLHAGDPDGLRLLIDHLKASQP